MNVWRRKAGRLPMKQVISPCKRAVLQSVRTCSSSIPRDSPEISALKMQFRKSNTCALLRDRNQDLFILGDLHGSEQSLERIKTCIDILKPRILAIEETGPDSFDYSGINKKFRGPAHSKSYLERYSKMYPTLGSKMTITSNESDTIHCDTIVWHLEKLDKAICGARPADAPFDPQWTEPWCKQLPTGEPLDVGLVREAHRGFLTGQLSLYVSGDVARRRRNMPANNRKVPLGWAFSYGDVTPEEASMDDKAEKEVMDGLKFLTTFNEAELMSQSRFAAKVDKVKTLDDFERIENGAEIRNMTLNKMFRLTEVQGEENMKKFFDALHMIWCGRERDLLRQIRQVMFDEYVKRNQRVVHHFTDLVRKEIRQSGDATRSGSEPDPEVVAEHMQKFRDETRYDEVPIGPVLAVVTLGHVQGIVNLWNSPVFWSSEVENFNDYVSFHHNKDIRDEYMRETRRMTKEVYGLELKDEYLENMKEYSEEELHQMQQTLEKTRRAGFSAK